jgi:NitT/TauT family transport system substrate-binding protein
MWNRREWGWWGISALLGAGVPPLRAQPRTPAPVASRARVHIAVEDRSAFCYLPLTIAERLGYFAAEGLEVQVRETGDLTQAAQALLSGSAQVLSGPYSLCVDLSARGHDCRSIVLQGRSPQLVLGVSRRTMAKYRDLRDLDGRKLAVSALGSAGQRMTQVLLGNVRQPSVGVQYVPLGSPSSALAAFRNGLVDAICYTEPVVTRLEQEGNLRVVADTRTVRGSAEVFGGPMPAGCLSVSSDYEKNHPEACQALANATVHALKWLQTAGPSDIIKTVPESYFMGDRALYLAAFSRAREAWAPDGVMPDAGPATMARVLARFSEAAPLKPADLEQTFTNVYALKAKARFRA